MNVASFYKSLNPDQQTMGGVGQGGGSYWEQSVGMDLQLEIAAQLGATFHGFPRAHGKDSYDRVDFAPPEVDFDIAYIQLFEVPTKRPAKFVYSILSDYLHMEACLDDFLERARPDVIVSLQYGRDDLAERCAKYGCKVVQLPWFNADTALIEPNTVRDVGGLCTGTIGGTYPRRDAIHNYLQSLNRGDVVLSGSKIGCHGFSLDHDAYYDHLRRAQYYFSGGIFDFQIPPKYFEVVNYGACLVTHDLPLLADAGFVHDETCIIIETLDEIPMILDSDRWERIGEAGKAMVDQRHSLAQRATDIIEVYCDG